MSASPLFPILPKDWKEESEQIAGPFGKNSLFFRAYSRTGGVRHPQFTGRALFIVHGFGEQSDRFLHFPHYLHTSVDIIGLIDLPGHGKSIGQRGHIENFSQYSEAALAGFEHFKKVVSAVNGDTQTSLHWMGASMGGLTTLFTLLQQPSLGLRSVIVTEPQLGIAVPVPWIKEFMGRLIEPVLGRLSMHNEIAASALSNDKSVQDHYAMNPLNHSKVTPRTYVQMQKTITWVNAAANNGTPEFHYPLLVIVPLDDKVVGWKPGLKFFEGVRMSNGQRKQLQTFVGFNHEAFNEIGKERAFVALEDWLQSFK